MNFLDGYKTYLGGIGMILIGLGGILAQKTGLVQGGTDIALGLVAVGARSFGQKILDTLKATK